MTYSTPEQRAAAVAGLRALADFLEANPAVPLRSFEPACAHVHPQGDDASKVTEVDRIAAALGVSAGPRNPGSSHYVARREFGPAESPVVYEAVAIPTEAMARYYAANSYYNNVQPEVAAAPGEEVA